MAGGTLSDFTAIFICLLCEIKIDAMLQTGQVYCF